MSFLNNVFSSATSVADGVAHIFTGMGSELGKMNQFTRSKQLPSTRQQPMRSRHLRSLLFLKQPYTKQQPSQKQHPSNQPYAKEPRADPAVISNSTTLCAHRPHLLCEIEDDRWMHEQAEGLQPVAEPFRWRSCRGCASLCSAHLPTCEVCEARVASLLENLEAPDFGNWDEASEDEDAASEYERGVESGSDYGESISGTIDVPPPKGTQVKVLYDDDQWHLAEVLAVRGTQARVCFECGMRVVVDFEVHAVRLAEYVSAGETVLQDDEDEDNEDEDDESDKEGDDEEVDKGSEEKNDDVSEEEEEEQDKGSEEDSEEESDDEQEEDQGIQDLSSEDKAKDETDSVAAEAKDAEEDSGSEDIQIAGTLDEAPPVGTLVKILRVDDRWHLARVNASNGTKAIIVHSDKGEEEELDFDVHAVRPSGYVSQDEESDENVKTKHVEAKTVCEAEPTVQVNTGEKEHRICKVNYEAGSGSSNRAPRPGVRMELEDQSDEEF